MKHREPLDEAIDRVAMRMTQSGDTDRVEIQPVWLTAWPAFAKTLRRGRPAFAGTLWRGRLLAGVFGVAAVVVAVVLLRTPRVEEHRSAPPVGASALVAWSPLAVAVTDTGIPKGVPSTARESQSAARAFDRPRSLRAQDGDRPTWGIPFIEEPAALAVAAPTVAQLEIDAVAVEAIEIEPLTVSPINAGVQDSKEQ